MGVQVELRGSSWTEAQRAFEACEADVLETAFDTMERRAKNYSFSAPYASIEVPVFIHKSISGIRSASDLKGFHVAVKAGDASIDSLAALGVTQVDTYSDYSEIVQAASRLETRIFCIDKPPALYYLYKMGVDRDFRIAFTLKGGAFHRAVLKDRPELLALVELGFAQVPKATYAKIDREWLGLPLGSRLDLRLAAIVMATLFLLLLSSFMVSWGLRRRVFAATAELRDKVVLLEEKEEQLSGSVAEKEILLKEIHHRVKNNMQVISSLLSLQSESFIDKEDKRLLAETQGRIRAMSILHELLYGSPDLASICVVEYMRSLADGLASGYGRDPIDVEGPGELRFRIDEALPLGLIANELVSNAIKYAYPQGESGRILVSMAEEPLGIRFSVEDWGLGLDAGLDPSTCSSMGFLLVRSLAVQIGATLSFAGPPGLRVELILPRP
jgi:two-component sensor histidine kinase